MIQNKNLLTIILFSVLFFAYFVFSLLIGFSIFSKVSFITFWSGLNLLLEISLFLYFLISIFVSGYIVGIGFKKNSKVRFGISFKDFPFVTYASIIYLTIFLAGVGYGFIPKLEDKTEDINLLTDTISDASVLINNNLEKGNNSFVREEFLDNSYNYGLMEISLKKMGSSGFNPYDFLDSDFEYDELKNIHPNYMKGDNVKDETIVFNNLDRLTSPKYPLLNKDNYVTYDLPAYTENQGDLLFTGNYTIQKEKIIGSNYQLCLVAVLSDENLADGEAQVFCNDFENDHKSILGKDIISMNDKKNNGKNSFEKSQDKTESIEFVINLGKLDKNDTKISTYLAIVNNGEIQAPNSKANWTIYDEKLFFTNDKRNIETNIFCIEGHHKGRPYLMMHKIFIFDYSTNVYKEQYHDIGRCPDNY